MNRKDEDKHVKTLEQMVKRHMKDAPHKFSQYLIHPKSLIRRLAKQARHELKEEDNKNEKTSKKNFQ